MISANGLLAKNGNRGIVASALSQPVKLEFPTFISAVNLSPAHPEVSTIFNFFQGYVSEAQKGIAKPEEEIDAGRVGDNP